MNRILSKIITVVLTSALVFLVLSDVNDVSAANNVYVNDGNSVIDGDINSTYAVGGDGYVSVVDDSYAITADGVTKIGSESNPDIPGGQGDGTTINISYDTAKVGLAYKSNALSEARLENAVGRGYQFGYFDDSRNFHAIASTIETRLSMRAFGSKGVNVYSTGTNNVIYSHDGSDGNELAIMPKSSGKALTWFKGNRYYGGFEYFRYQGSSNLTVINVVNIEDYVKGVLTKEMSPSWPIEALKAQAVCARTYLARNINGTYSKYNFDVTNDTYCQVYGGREGSNKTEAYFANSDAAVDQTAGEYLTYNGRLCDALYFSSDGGGTEDSENIFYSALGYLRGVIDPFEADIPNFSYKSWEKEYSGSTISNYLGNVIGDVTRIEPVYSDTNNVIKIAFYDANGNSTSLTKSNIYSKLRLPSIHFTVTKIGDNFRFDGSGWGHNVGMSQWGAYSMAKYHGGNYRQILRFYYTNVNISKGY